MTYADRYLAALLDALQRGGSQELVDATTVEVNDPTPAGLRAWLALHPRVTCATCGALFTADPATAQLSHEVACALHPPTA